MAILSEMFRSPITYGTSLLAAATFSGFATRTKVPEDSLGISTDKKTVLSTPQIVVHQPGTSWWGSLRYPDFRVIKPGESTVHAGSVELTPGTWDKVVVASQKSLLMNTIPVLKDAVQSGKTDHLIVDFRVKVVAPTETDKLIKLYRDLHSTDLEGALNEAVTTALHDKEGALNRRFFAPKLTDVEAAIAAKIKDKFDFSDAQVQLTKIAKVTKSDKDREAVREETRDKLGAGVEVLFEVSRFFF